MRNPLVLQPLFLILVLTTAFVAQRCTKTQLAVQPPDNGWCHAMPPGWPGCPLPPNLTGVLVDYHGELREVAWYTDKHGVNQIALLEGTW